MSNAPLASNDAAPAYMTVKEVAAVLRKHPITIYRWLEAGQRLPEASKVGQDWLIPRYAVLRLLHSGHMTIH